MDPKVTEMRGFFLAAHHYAYTELIQLKDKIYNCDNLEELADYGYGLKRISELVDDLRKELNKLSEDAGRIQCALQTTQGNVKPVKTEYCTATPKVEFYIPIPKKEKDPEKYKALCDFLELSPEVVDNEAVRVHWPGMTALMTARMAEGKPLPEGFTAEDTGTKYSVQYRKATNSEF